MVVDLNEQRRRRISKNFGNLYAESLLLETEKPLLYRRLRQVMRGFRKSDIPKIHAASIDTPLCDIDRISEQAAEVLELEDELMPASKAVNELTIRDMHISPTYERIQALYKVIEIHPFNKKTVRGLIFLTVCTRAVLYDREAVRSVKLWFDTVDDRFILYVTPKNGIDESLDPSIKAMVLARTLGVQLEVTDENQGVPCYKLVASSIGEFLYEVRKLDGEEAEAEYSEGV